MAEGREERAERPPPHSRESAGARAVRWAGLFAVFYAIWFPLTFPNYLEIHLVGLVMAAVAATAMDVVRGQGELRFSPRPRWALRSWRLAWAVLRDTATVFGALWRRVVRGEDVRGTFLSVRFEPGGDDERGTARRAVADAVASVAPNTVSLGIDRDEGLMVIHQLVRDDGPPNPADPLGVR